MKISLKNNNELAITFTYNERLIACMRDLPARRYDARSKAWYIPVQSAYESVRLLESKGFSVSGEARQALEDSEAIRKRADEVKRASDAVFDTSLPLFPYQRAGACFLSLIGSGLLADSVGLGKTLQALAVIETIGKGARSLVLVPAVLKYQWESEIKRFLPQWKAQVIDGNAMTRTEQWQEEADIYIANYELLLRDNERLSAFVWDIIVCDEATRISNIRAKTYKALMKLKARRRIALTGTPVQNRPDDLFGILNWTNPGMLGSFMNFIERYCYRNQWGGVLGYHNLEELARRIEPFMIRRRKEDVLKDLPEKTIIDVTFKL